MKRKKYPIQTWTDPIVLAGLLRYLDARQITPRSRSHLVSLLLSLLHDALLRDGKFKPFPSAEEAIDFLHEHGLGSGGESQRRAASKIIAGVK